MRAGFGALASGPGRFVLFGHAVIARESPRGLSRGRDLAVPAPTNTAGGQDRTSINPPAAPRFYRIVASLLNAQLPITL